MRTSLYFFRASTAHLAARRPLYLLCSLDIPISQLYIDMLLVENTLDLYHHQGVFFWIDNITEFVSQWFLCKSCGYFHSGLMMQGPVI
jgi:hypothetical protein